jgi:hypothetical protein
MYGPPYTSRGQRGRFPSGHPGVLAHSPPGFLACWPRSFAAARHSHDEPNPRRGNTGQHGAATVMLCRRMADLVVVGGGVVGVAESVVGSGQLVLVATLARKAERGIVLGPAPGHSGGRQARGRHGALDGRGGHVLPVCVDDQFLLAASDRHVPAIVDGRPVASVQPAAGERAGWRGLRLAGETAVVDDVPDRLRAAQNVGPRVPGCRPDR